MPWLPNFTRRIRNSTHRWPRWTRKQRTKPKSSRRLRKLLQIRRFKCSLRSNRFRWRPKRRSKNTRTWTPRSRSSMKTKVRRRSRRCWRNCRLVRTPLWFKCCKNWDRWIWIKSMTILMPTLMKKVMICSSMRISLKRIYSRTWSRWIRA